MKHKKKFLIMLILMMIIFIAPKIAKEAKGILINPEKDLILLEEIETDYQSDVVYKKMDVNLIQYWDGILYLYDMTGKKKWNIYLGVVNPIIKTNDNSIYIVDHNKNQMIRVDKNGEIFYRHTMEGELMDFQVCKDNFVLLQNKIQNNITKLKVLDQEGREYSNILLTEGEIINFTISKADNYIGINTLITNNILESRLLIYDIQGQLIGSTNLEEELALGFFHDSKGNLIVVKEEEIMGISKDNEVIWKTALDPVRHFKGFFPKYIVLYSGEVEKNRFIHTSKGEELKILQYNGKVLGEANLNDAIHGLDLYDDTIVLYSQGTIYLLDKDGNIEMEYRHLSDIEEVFVFPKGHVALITKGKVSFMRIREK